MPCASAATDLRLEITTSSAALAGAISANGSAPAFVLYDTKGTVLEEGFNLTAKHARIEVDRIDPAFGGAVAVGGSPTTDAWEAEQLDATVSATRTGFAAEVFARPGFPSPSWKLEGSCTNLEAVQNERLESQPKVDPRRQEIGVDMQEGLRMTACGGGMLVLQGAFILSLWEVDLEYRADQEDGTLQTGRQPSRLLGPAGGTVSGTVGESLQAYLYVEDGRLGIHHFAGVEHALYAPSAETKLIGSVTASGNGRMGTSSTDIDFANRSMRADGTLAGRWEPAGAVLRGNLAGLVDRVHLDDQPLALPAGAALGTALAWPGWASAAAAAMVGLAWATAFAARKGILPWMHDHRVRLKEFARHLAVDRNLPMLACPLLTLAIRRDPWDGEALSLRAACRLQRGRVRRALDDARQAHDKLRGTHLVGENALVASQAAAAAGLDGEAIEWLAMVRSEDPELFDAERRAPTQVPASFFDRALASGRRPWFLQS